jgi:hypothetical protein
MVAYDNPGSEMADLMRRVRILETQSGADGSGFGGGDGDHPGTGFESIQIGVGAQAAPITQPDADEAVAIGSSATADGFGACAFGARSYAQYENASAFGWLSFAGHAFATAIGYRAVTTAANQIRLGRSSETVSVPGNLTVAGTFSNPSARHLKQNIAPAPNLPGVFPVLVEYEYIEGDGPRRLGYIADDLVGTDAERFVQVDADGNPEAIDYLGLLVAQNAQLQARLTVLEKLIEGLTNG